ncbi:MAG: glycosyltransferase family 2 protein [Parcubacteria group bacterium]|jgi:hypothetical protein
MSKYPKIFILVLNYNGAACIGACLNSIFKINYPNFEVVVVDNASTDGSLELARRQFSRCHFIKNESNIGFSAGNNVGIKFALERMADWILLLNQDTLVFENFLDKLLEAAHDDPQAGILSPVIMSDSKKIWFSGGKIDWWKMRTTHLRYIKRTLPYETEFISGCAMFIRSNVFRQTGLLDEDFFLYWEDADFSFRAKKDGFSLLVVPESRIIHLEKSEEKKESKVYWLVISGLMFFQKNSSGLLRWWLKIYYQLRKIKNWRDIKNGKNQLALAVKRAYDDFDKYAK